MTDERAGERRGYDRFSGNVGGAGSCGIWRRISALTCRPAVISEPFDGPARREFRQPLAVHDRTRLSRAVFREAGEPIKEANRPDSELHLRHRSATDHSVCSSATGQSSHAEAAQ